MDLLTKQIESNLPRTVADPKNPMVYCKFFLCGSGWTWYATTGARFDDDFVFYGLAEGDYTEWGTFSLRELESIRCGFFRVERDVNFRPKPLSEISVRF